MLICYRTLAVSRQIPSNEGILFYGGTGDSNPLLHPAIVDGIREIYFLQYIIHFLLFTFQKIYDIISIYIHLEVFMRTFLKDKLEVRIYENRTLMGEAAAKDISAKIKELLLKKTEINMIFAAAPSQNDVLLALVNDKSIEWNRVNAYHMDEYVGLAADAPQGFGNFLREHIFGLVQFKSVNYIDCTAKNPEEECGRYGKLLRENPTDIVVMGIGENGHIAFNDPGVADFNDKETVKVVELDAVCRQQQVNDGCFKALSDVPTHALTLTVPTLISAPWLFCIVPVKTKANAVRATVNGEICEECPASILRTRENAVLYLDNESSALI